MKTYSAKTEDVQRAWHLIDLDGKTVGRAAAEIAKLLRGKHKPQYTPHVDTGDFVIVVNAEKAVFTGKKLQEKLYRRHSGYPGGLTEITAAELLQKKPEMVITYAVQGMLPKGPLGRQMLKKLKVTVGPDHAHAAQKPVKFEL
ncbi:MAG: 50S ribosomal protein L13 [bacterium]